MMAWRGVSLGQVEPASWALFSPVLLQEMNALSWSCLSPHCFSGPSQCGTVCTPAHTAAIMSLQHPSCSCEHWCPSQFICSGITQKGIMSDIPSQGPTLLWKCPELSNIPPPTRPEKQANGDLLCCVYLWGVWGSDFQSPHGISFHSFLIQSRKQWSP